MILKKKILVFVDWFKPGFKAGGPIQSVYNLTTRLKNDFDFYIFTSDTDLGETTPYNSVEPDKWTDFEGLKVFYGSKEFQSYSNIKSVILNLKPDSVYVNSLFSLKYAIYPMLLHKKGVVKKLIVAPRGMLGEGALKIKSFKKQLFLKLFNFFGVLKNVVWHATTNLEKLEIEQNFSGDKTIFEAENFPNTLSAQYNARTKKVGELKLFFFSRISEKKNLIGALKILENCKTKIEFNIYGGIENNEYWNQCQLQINELPVNIIVNYKGAINPSKIEDEFKEFHAFILPTFNENFGHAIIEAMNCGAIPILSDQTPWRNFEKNKIGFDLPLNNPNVFSKHIDFVSNFNQNEFDEWSKNAYNYSLKVILNEQRIADTKCIFNN